MMRRAATLGNMVFRRTQPARSDGHNANWDNQSWAGAVRYTMGLGASAIDEATDDKLTFYLGYEYISFANPHADPNAFIGSTAEGGYLISKVTPNPYQTNKVLQLSWAGVRDGLGAKWSFAAGYYHADQGAYPGTVSTPRAGTVQTSANSAGSYNDASFVADCQITKHFDVYAGVNCSMLDGGLASGYLNNNMTTVATGVRLKFRGLRPRCATHYIVRCYWAKRGRYFRSALAGISGTLQPWRAQWTHAIAIAPNYLDMQI